MLSTAFPTPVDSTQIHELRALSLRVRLYDCVDLFEQLLEKFEPFLAIIPGGGEGVGIGKELCC